MDLYVFPITAYDESTASIFWILYDCHSYAYERHVLFLFFFFETPHHLMYRDRFLHFCIICLLQCVEKKKVYNYIWIYFCKRLYLLANMLHQLFKEEELWILLAEDVPHIFYYRSWRWCDFYPQILYVCLLFIFTDKINYFTLLFLPQCR